MSETGYLILGFLVFLAMLGAAKKIVKIILALILAFIVVAAFYGG